MALKMHVSRVHLHGIFFTLSPKRGNEKGRRFIKLIPAERLCWLIAMFLILARAIKYLVHDGKILVFEWETAARKTGAIKGHLFLPQREEVSSLRDAS